MDQALTQNEDAEQQVAKTADDLKLVNLKLTQEIAERIVIDSELAIRKPTWPKYATIYQKSR